GDAAAVASVVAQALQLYSGDFLVGEDNHPDVQRVRSRLRALLLRRLAAGAAALQKQGNDEAAAAAAVLRRVVELDPLAEAVVRQWMQCLLRLGRRAEAFEAYRGCRQQLSVLLQIRPAPETERLAATLREA
ncbi:MAG: bacterial transcriptional activator domain-containing protein, partial [Rubrivivax sp.]|nr:bacterial transcriptional activator domain-containing protein [Rubrivivax sp.]